MKQKKKNRRLLFRGTLTSLWAIVRTLLKPLLFAYRLIVLPIHRFLNDHLKLYAWWHAKPYAQAVDISVAGLCLAVALSLILSGTPAKAFQNWAQSDWSGGIGPSTTDQYSAGSNIVTTTPGQVRLGMAGPDGWCNNASCDSTWTKRQKMQANNSGSTQTDFPVQLDLNYNNFNSDMQSDFDDIRFTDLDGNALPYYILWKTDSDTARVLVKLSSVPNGSTNFYMYYGNPAASSASDGAATLSFYDNFDGNTLSNHWNVSGSDGTVNVANNSATLGGGVGGTTIDTNGTFTLDANQQYSLFYNESITQSCDLLGGSSQSGLRLVATPGYGIGYMKNINLEGNPCGSQYDVRNIYVDTYNAQPVLLNSDTTYMYKLVHRINDLDDFYYSADINTSPNFTLVPSAQGATRYNDALFLSFSNSAVDAGRVTKISNVRLFKSSELINASTDGSSPQSVNENTGYIESNVFDLGAGSPVLGNVNYTLDYDVNDVTYALIKVRTGNSADMSDAPAFSTCDTMWEGFSASVPATNSNCVTVGQRYIQYRFDLAAFPDTGLRLTNFSLEWDNDSDPPTTNASNIIMHKGTDWQTAGPSDPVVDEGSWSNAGGYDNDLYVNWSAGADNDGGSGIKGYCMYVGTDSGGDPASSSGVISYSGRPSPINTGGACPFAVADTNFDYYAETGHQLSTDAPSGSTVYIRVKAIDNFNNVYQGDATSTNFRFDYQSPTTNTVASGPGGITNSKIFTVTWLTDFPAQIYDNDSELAGIRYCVTNLTLYQQGHDCYPYGSDNHWSGPLHHDNAIYDTSDVFPTNATGITTVQADADRIDPDGVNIMAIGWLDNAGNFGYTRAVVQLSNESPSAPQNLHVNPASNTTNSFSFTWDAPATFVGSESTLDYCWSVNVAIAADGSNCTWTGQGITQLAAGAFATQQGTNTMYVMAKSSAGNFDHNHVASVSFSASTTAPGIPREVEISDVSIRATSTWRLALSWAAPEQVGAGISSYKLFRSTDASSYSQVGTTTSSNLSFIDSGLSQTAYYYYVKACDNANSCSVPSAVVSKLPTGRFTEPAHLTADTDQPKVKDISTRKATIYWFTDRESDSKVAFGTSPGHYEPEQVVNSTQTASHSLNVTNLQPDTLYYYTSYWTDQDGNTGQSLERTFKTAPAPVVSEVSTSDVTVSGATVNFKVKNASSINIKYGKSEGFGGSKVVNTSTSESIYSAVLSGLDDGAKYFFTLESSDSDGNTYNGSIYSFTTPALPKILNLKLSTIEGQPSSTQKITWQTNVPATSEVSYAVKDQKPTEIIDSALVTDHSVTVSGLQDDSDYSLTARSRDAGGNAAVSGAQLFHTALDTRPPKISNINVEASVVGNGSDARGQIVVSWKSDEPATSQVSFGQGQAGSYTNRTAEDTKLVTEHIVIVSDLPTSTIYHLQAISHDKANNSAVSDNQSAIVGRGNENVFTIIFNALQKIFGL